ncbi:hypothetical protein [Flavobacterium sp. N1736]|uniref:hypothetical protein n=1 Tax=Flavobacterium sp. N1736 TaxID=2986823 RepID=UPI002224EA4D|nr:hypothetical protein [Flavobacterium sp. N1736]
MSEKKLSKATEKKLIDFFNNNIDPESFAKAIRELSYIIALNNITKNETRYTQKANLEQGFYWLSELAKILNP